jgi:hypothetical protein
MTGDGNNFDVVLAEIDDLVPSSRTDDEDSFSLIFAAPANRPRGQGIRTFHSDRLGHVDLFVVPIDRGVRSLRLQSIVNRI